MSLDTFYSYYPVLGLRSWEIHYVDGQGIYDPGLRTWTRPRPISIRLHGLWGWGWTNIYQEATCRPRGFGAYHGRHTAPAEDCMCGIYAYKPTPDIWRGVAYSSPTRSFFGLVAMEDVIEHDLGYRSARALILAGWVPREMHHFFADWPIPIYTRVEALAKHAAYLEHDPSKITKPRRENGSDWPALAENQTRHGPSPFRTETEAEWRSRTGFTRTTTYPYPNP